MRTLSVILIGSLTVVLMLGCSDRQEEAEKLAQEMSDLEAVDSAAGDSAAIADSLAAAEAMTDAAAVPDETVAQPMPPVPRGEGYTVQVASCENLEYAQHLIGVYANRGYEAYVTTITYDDQTYYRVRLGDFETLSEAQALKAELADRFSVETWIDRLDQ